jgi:hypothetical protein
MSRDGDETESTLYFDLGLLYQPRMINDDEYEAIVEWLAGGNRSTRRKTVPVAICPSQIPYGLTRGSNPGHRCGKLATNCLSYSAALERAITYYL